MMKVTLLDHTSNPTEKIGLMAAICYDADTSPEANLRRAAKCKDSGHLATMRFAYATFKVEGISRIASHQIVRMAHAGILQRSQRYVKDATASFVEPPMFHHMDQQLEQRWVWLMNESSSLYLDLVAAGIKKEDARYALLQACTTELNLCLNFQGWQDFLKNRTDKAAQWEVRLVALEIQKQLQAIAPTLF